MSYLKRVVSQPPLKYLVLATCSGLWLFGLVDQLSSTEATVKYLLVSLLMAAVAVL